MYLLKKSEKIRQILIFLLGFFFVYCLSFFYSVLSKEFIERNLLDHIENTKFLVPLSLTRYAVLSGGESVQMLAPVHGQIDRIFHYNGDVVQGGQPIIQLKDSVAKYDLQVQDAKNRLDHTLSLKDNYLLESNGYLSQLLSSYQKIQQNFVKLQEDREKQLENRFFTGSIDEKQKEILLQTESSLKKARLIYEKFASEQAASLQLFDEKIFQAKQQYEMMLNQYASMTFRAPVSGVLTAMQHNRGENITKGDLVFKIQLPINYISVLVSAQEYLYLDQNTSVYIETKTRALTGTITSILPSELKQNVFELRIGLSEKLFPSGEVVKVSLPMVASGVLILDNDLFSGVKNQNHFSALLDNQR